MPCWLPCPCKYETNKLVRIHSVWLGSLKWILNGTILLAICIVLGLDKGYQEFDLVVSSVTTKVKGVARMHLPGVGDVVWDGVDCSGPARDKNSFFVVTNVIVTNNQKQGNCPEQCLYSRFPLKADCVGLTRTVRKETGTSSAMGFRRDHV